jgi:hypothetical protein
MASYLVNLNTYNKLAAYCLSLNTKLQRINARVNRQKRLIKGKSRTDTIAFKTFTLANTSALFKSTLFILCMFASLKPTRQVTSGLTSLLVICYNCKKPGYFSCDCPKLRHADLKEIKKDKDKNKRALKSKKDHV